jgi:hypothetical protein
MSAEDQRIKILIEQVVTSILGRYVFKLMLAVLILSGTIMTTGFYGGVQLSHIHDAIEKMTAANNSHDARITLLEKSMPQAYTRWTANMMSEYTDQIRRENPSLKVPDIQPIRRSFLHETTP